LIYAYANERLCFAIVTIEEARLHFESVPLDEATFPCRLGSTRIALDTAAP